MEMQFLISWFTGTMIDKLNRLQSHEQSDLVATNM